MLERFFTPGLAEVAYAIADQDAGVAAVIDPRRDVEAYTGWATAHGLRIAAVLETHIHADFVSGAGELAAATGATVYASWFGDQTFPHQPLADGEQVAVGDLRGCVERGRLVMIVGSLAQIGGPRCPAAPTRPT